MVKYRNFFVYFSAEETNMTNLVSMRFCCESENGRRQKSIGA